MKKSMAVFPKKNMADIRALPHSTKLLTFVPKNSVRNVFISLVFSTIDSYFYWCLLLFSLHNRQCFDSLPGRNCCGYWLSPPSSNSITHVGPIMGTCHYVEMELWNIGAHQMAKNLLFCLLHNVMTSLHVVALNSMVVLIMCG